MDQETVKELVANELQKLGVDITTEESRARFRADLAWSRQSRLRCEKVLGASLIFIIGGVLSIIGGWILHGAANSFIKGVISNG